MTFDTGRIAARALHWRHESTTDRERREDVRIPPRARRRFARAAALRGPRPARSERRGEVDARAHDHGTRPARQRLRHASSASRLRPATPNARAEVGVVPQEIALYPNLSSHENLTVFGRYLGLSGARARRGDEARARLGGADRSRERAGQDLLRRHEAAAQHGRRRAAPAARAAARRADRRRRSAVARAHLPDDRIAARRRRLAHLHHALHGRGGAPLRPHRHHRPRPRHRHRHEGRAGAGHDRHRSAKSSSSLPTARTSRISSTTPRKCCASCARRKRREAPCAT